MSESDLEVLTLMVIDELKNKEIAQVTGIPLRTIERKKARFKNLFKDSRKSELDDGRYLCR